MQVQLHYIHVYPTISSSNTWSELLTKVRSTSSKQENPVSKMISRSRLTVFVPGYDLHTVAPPMDIAVLTLCEIHQGVK